MSQVADKVQRLDGRQEGRQKGAGVVFGQTAFDGFVTLPENDSRPRALARYRDGLTLVELLVVLTILAILATVAVVSTETVLRQGRFEATQQTLQAIEEAVLGPGLFQSEDGTAAVGGFVADIGRLPYDLSELWLKPEDVDEFDFWEMDDKVFVPFGWRGPYLRLPVGATNLLDGWGKEMQTVRDPETGEITRIYSEGGKLAEDGPDSDLPDLVVEFRNEWMDRYRTTIQVIVWQRDEYGGLEPAAEDMHVVLFTRTRNGLEELSANDEQFSGPPHTFFFDEIPLGLHVMRAYSKDTTRRSRSAPIPIQVHPLRSTTWKLVLFEEVPETGDTEDDNED